MQKPGNGEMLEKALQFWEWGFHPIPLGDPWTEPPAYFMRDATSDVRQEKWAKKPRVQWGKYQKECPSDQQIKQWWTRWPNANIGLITGINVDVVDADTLETDTWLGENVARTPWMVRTARGTHRYYRCNPKLTLTNSASTKAGLDIRGKGGYVVAPGSTYADGTQSQWVLDESWSVDDPDELPMLSHDDMGKINGYGGKVPVEPQSAPVGEVLGNLAAVSLPHDGRQEVVGNRNNALASLAGQWVREGISIEGIVGKAREWNSKNPEPLPDSEVLTTIISIITTHAKNTGGSIPNTAPSSSSLEVLSLADLVDRPPEQPENFWRDGVLFRGSRMLIGGAPKVGKSRFVVQMGLAAATGGEFLGVYFAKPVKVLWFQAEIHQAFLHRRLNQAIMNMPEEAIPLARENFVMTGRCDLDLRDPAALAIVRKIINDVQPDIIIFDPIINFSSADEKDNGEIRLLLRSIDEIGADFNCSTVLVHHIKKGAGAGDFEGVRGASALRGWYDTGVMISNDSELMISYELRNVEGINPQGLETDPEDGSFSVCELSTATQESGTPSRKSGGRQAAPEVEDTVKQTQLNTIVEILRKQPDGYYTAELIEKLKPILGRGKTYIKDLLKPLRSHPQIQTQQLRRHTLYTYRPTNKAAENDDE